MTTIGDLDLSTLLNHLGQLRLETIQDVPFADVEWILADFLLSWGQRLPLDATGWPPEAQRASLRKVGLTVLPFSTASDFPSVHPDQVRVLALALTSLNLYVMLLDPVVDEPPAVPAAAKLAIQPVLLHFYRSLSWLFPAGSSFWTEVKRLMDLMSQTMLEEHRRLSGPPRPFSLDEFKRIAWGKMAFARINGVALAMLNGTPELVPVLAECWDAIGLASIIRDDALDWRDDYGSANYTYLLCQMLLSPPFREQVEAGHLPELAELSAALFCTDLIESFYMLARDELEAAARGATEIHCPALANVLRLLQAEMHSQFAKTLNHKLEALATIVASDF